jgi:diguanylate cyclase (GGDEF)-like protein
LRAPGDEFLIVLCGGLGKPAEAAVIGRKVLQELARPFHVGGNEIDISCSIGISIYPQDGRDVPTLVANADTAMYQARKGGRSNYRFFGSGIALPHAEGVR